MRQQNDTDGQSANYSVDGHLYLSKGCIYSSPKHILLYVAEELRI